MAASRGICPFKAEAVNGVLARVDVPAYLRTVDGAPAGTVHCRIAVVEERLVPIQYLDSMSAARLEETVSKPIPVAVLTIHAVLSAFEEEDVFGLEVVGVVRAIIDRFEAVAARVVVLIAVDAEMVEAGEVRRCAEGTVLDDVIVEAVGSTKRHADCVPVADSFALQNCMPVDIEGSRNHVDSEAEEYFPRSWALFR